MRFIRAAFFFSLSVGTAAAFGAEDLDAGLVRQMNVLEAQANTVRAATERKRVSDPMSPDQSQEKVLDRSPDKSAERAQSDKIKPSALFADSETLTAGAAPTLTEPGKPGSVTSAAPAADPHDNAGNKVSETDIPVLTKFNKKVETDSVSNPARLLATFGIIIGILGGGIFFLRRYTKNHTAGAKHTQIQIVAQHHLGPKKSLAIIRVAGESILVGVTDQSISMIKQLHILDEELPEEEVAEDFRQRLERSRETTPRAAITGPKETKPPVKTPIKRAAHEPRAVRPPINARQVYEPRHQEELNEGDEFMMRGIRDIVSDGLRNRKTLV